MSSQLRRLEISYCLFRSCNEALKKFPPLKELNLYSTRISKESIETASHYCPMLQTPKVNRIGCRFWTDEDDEESIVIDNEFAKAIGENLIDLRHLELIGCRMSNVGLQVILDGCCHLETLDLRDCWNIDLNKDLLKRCSEQIKHLKQPYDSLEGCPYLYEYSGVIEYADTSKPGLITYVYLDFEDYDAYTDYYLEEAAANASFNNLHFGRASETRTR